MSGSKKVLIAVDGSKHSEDAFDWYIKNLYKPEDAVIAVVSPQITYKLSSISEEDKNPEHIKGIIEDENKRVASTIERFKEKMAKDKVKGEVTCATGSSPGPAIVEMADARNVSFIVLGSRGRGVTRRTPVGHVCDFVVNEAKVPVMICKDSA